MQTNQLKVLVNNSTSMKVLIDNLIVPRLAFLLLPLLLLIPTIVKGEAIDLANLMEVKSQLGIVSAKLKRQGALRRLKIHYQPEARCNFGDLDLIGLELGDDLKANLILTIEPILKEDKEVETVVYELPKDDSSLRQKQEFNLFLPAVKRTELLGIFICKDQNNSRSCREKELKSYDEMFERYRVLVDREGNGQRAFEGDLDAAPSDKIYFFRPIIISDKTLDFSERGWNVDDYRLFSSYLQQRTTRIMDREIAEVRRFGEALGSFAIKAGNEGINLRLPYVDHKKCNMEE